MSSIPIVPSLLCFLAGIVIAWIIRKLAFEKEHVNRDQYDDLNKQFQELNTAKALSDEKNKTHGEQIQSLEVRHLAITTLADDLKEKMAAANARIDMLSREKDSLLREQSGAKDTLEQKINEAQESARKIAELNVKLENQSDLYTRQKADLEQMSEILKRDFSLLANTILDEKTQKFNESQQKELNSLLEPLKTNLSEFKQQVEKTYKTENDERISLREQVKHMMTLNETLAKEAKSLTQALSGSSKKQGDWGERILESILEYSGLQKGIHYFAQETSSDDDGTRIRPDVLVKYPGERSIVIDSKVSLSHYDQLCREENPAAQSLLMKSLLQSIRSHIDGLSNKNYTHITNSLDMVIMFLPVEAAYITALQNDPELQQYAYRKNVLLISPANLLMAMKLIYDMWKRDAINKNAEAVAERAGKLYDKLAGFVENFERIGKAIGSLEQAYGDAHKQLTSGRGNILMQAEQMKQLEIKANKQINYDLHDLYD